MRQTVNKRSFFRAFTEMNRSTKFSTSSLDALFDYLEGIDEDYELDVIKLCCDYTEESIEGAIGSYDIEIDDDADEEGRRDAVVDYLNRETIVIYYDDVTVLYACF